MSIDVGSLQTFTNAELAIIYRSAAVNAAIAQQYSIGGRSLSRFSPKELNAMADAHAAAAARETRGSCSLAQFRNPE
jgi:hypothetical protein